jgi:hypothetical protein
MHLGALATTVRLLPDVVDVSIILDCSGLCALLFTMYGVARRWDPDRITRLAIGGSTMGSIFGVAMLAIGLIFNGG